MSVVRCLSLIEYLLIVFCIVCGECVACVKGGMRKEATACVKLNWALLMAVGQCVCCECYVNVLMCY